MNRPIVRIYVLVLLLLATLTAANAVWMLADPQHWYHDLPAAVPDTGPYNEHFVRDVGCACSHWPNNIASPS